MIIVNQYRIPVGYSENINTENSREQENDDRLVNQVHKEGMSSKKGEWQDKNPGDFGEGEPSHALRVQVPASAYSYKHHPVQGKSGS